MGIERYQQMRIALQSPKKVEAPIYSERECSKPFGDPWKGTEIGAADAQQNADRDHHEHYFHTMQSDHDSGKFIRTPERVGDKGVAAGNDDSKVHQKNDFFKKNIQNQSHLKPYPIVKDWHVWGFGMAKPVYTRGIGIDRNVFEEAHINAVVSTPRKGSSSATEPQPPYHYDAHSNKEY